MARSRVRVPQSVQAQVLARARRRCALCFGLNRDSSQKQGQIAHIDRNPANNELENLVYLCLEHHNQYDSLSRQAKGITKRELGIYIDELYRYLGAEEAMIEASSPDEKPLTMLMVDDEVAVGELMAIYAAQEGNRVIPAGYVVDIDVINVLIERYRPDAVILDVVMEFIGGDGVDLYFKLRRAGYDGEIIFYTNYGRSPVFLRDMILRGIDPMDILPKTEVAVDYQVLVKRLRARFDDRQKHERHEV